MKTSVTVIQQLTKHSKKNSVLCKVLLKISEPSCISSLLPDSNMCVRRSVVSAFLQPHGQPASLCAWNFPDKNTEVGSHSLFQGIFLTQELNLGLLHCRWILYHPSHQGSPQRQLTQYIISFLFFQRHRYSKMGTYSA